MYSQTAFPVSSVKHPFSAFVVTLCALGLRDHYEWRLNDLQDAVSGVAKRSCDLGDLGDCVFSERKLSSNWIKQD